MTHQNPNPLEEPQHAPAGKNKRPRPYTVEARWLRFFRFMPSKGEWFVDGRYRNERERDEAFDNKVRKITGHSTPWIEYRKGKP